jgi:hypothetical protein
MAEPNTACIKSEQNARTNLANKLKDSRFGKWHILSIYFQNAILCSGIT